MTIETMLAFNIALFAAMLSPGPALLVAIRTSLSGGRAAGVAIGCGLGVMAAIWTLMALLGLEAVFHLFPWAYALIKGAGALYLIYIAWKTWRGARDKISGVARPRSDAFRDGLLINLANPKSVIFAAAVLIVIFPADLTLVERGFVVTNHLVVELLFYTIVAFVISTEAVSRQYLRAKTWLDRFAAIVLGVLGLRLLFQK